MYQVMPPLSTEEYEALKADISENGVQVPVEYDEEGNILDGYHRVRACEELGIKDWPSITREGLTEEQKKSHARKLNLVRRHLRQEQKRELIKEQLRETPEKNNREVAKILGVSHHTVKKYRKELEGRGQIAHVEERTDSLGRKQPATKQKEAPTQNGQATKEVEEEISTDVTAKQTKPDKKEVADEKETPKDRAQRVEAEVRKVAERLGLGIHNDKVWEEVKNKTGISVNSIPKYLQHSKAISDYPDLSDMPMHKAIEEAGKRNRQKEEKEFYDMVRPSEYTEEERKEAIRFEDLYYEVDKLKVDIANGKISVNSWFKFCEKKYGRREVAERFAMRLNQLAEEILSAL